MSSSTKMTLYDAPAPNPYTVRLFIHERGGASLYNLEFKNVDIMNLENRHPEYKTINPRGELPALRMADGAVLTEITAICKYTGPQRLTARLVFSL